MGRYFFKSIGLENNKGCKFMKSLNDQINYIINIMDIPFIMCIVRNFGALIATYHIVFCDWRSIMVPILLKRKNMMIWCDSLKLSKSKRKSGGRCYLHLLVGDLEDSE